MTTFEIVQLLHEQAHKTLSLVAAIPSYGPLPAIEEAENTVRLGTAIQFTSQASHLPYLICTGYRNAEA